MCFNTFYRTQLKWISVAYKPEDEPSPSLCRNYEMYRHRLFLNFLRCVSFTTKISRNRIWRAFQRSITDPRYAICKNRLRCEFALLNEMNSPHKELGKRIIDDTPPSSSCTDETALTYPVPTYDQVYCV